MNVYVCVRLYMNDPNANKHVRFNIIFVCAIYTYSNKQNKTREQIEGGGRESDKNYIYGLKIQNDKPFNQNTNTRTICSLPKMHSVVLAMVFQPQILIFNCCKIVTENPIRFHIDDGLLPGGHFWKFQLFSLWIACHYENIHQQSKFSGSMSKIL